MTDRDRLASISDPAVPEVAALFGPSATEVLDVALSSVGGRCQSVGVRQIRLSPRTSVTVEYRAEVQWQGGASSTETLVATAGLPVPASTPVVEADGLRIAVWRFPDDPFLPGLAAASEPEQVQRLLERLGAPSQKVRLRRRAYRPGRRAVIEAMTPQARIFLKMVRPDRVGALQNKHTAMAGHVPVPNSYGWSEDLGLVALQAMPGKTLRKALEAGTRRLPDGQQFLRLLAALPESESMVARVDGHIQRAAHHARLLKLVVPDLVDRIDRVVDALEGVHEKTPIPVHGDFHSSQVLVRGSDIVGVIDVDSAGVGDRGDDLAGLLGHLATLALASPARRNINRYRGALIADFDRITDPAILRLRTAAVILGLATGPFRVQETHWPKATERRLALAERWIESASTISV